MNVVFISQNDESEYNEKERGATWVIVNQQRFLTLLGMLVIQRCQNMIQEGIRQDAIITSVDGAVTDHVTVKDQLTASAIPNLNLIYIIHIAIGNFMKKTSNRTMKILRLKNLSLRGSSTPKYMLMHMSQS